MAEQPRKSTTAHARILLRSADMLTDQYRSGQKSDHEVRRDFQRALDTFNMHAVENFLTRIDNSRFFRDPVPEHVDEAVPASSTDGR